VINIFLCVRISETKSSKRKRVVLSISDHTCFTISPKKSNCGVLNRFNLGPLETKSAAADARMSVEEIRIALYQT
jgi:hypothetical protein